MGFSLPKEQKISITNIIPQLFDGLSSEARQLSVQHELDDVDYVLPVRSDGQVGVNTLLHEISELRRLDFSTHDVDEFDSQFHIRLERQITARRTFKDKTEIWKR